MKGQTASPIGWPLAGVSHDEGAIAIEIAIVILEAPCLMLMLVSDVDVDACTASKAKRVYLAKRTARDRDGRPPFQKG